MVDLSGRVREIKTPVDQGDYFSNQPRKTVRKNNDAACMKRISHTIVFMDFFIAVSCFWPGIPLQAPQTQEAHVQSVR